MLKFATTFFRNTFLACLACLSLVAAASDRVALVIGNSSYKMAPLFNPENDARDMSKLLGQAGFQVFSKTNASRDELEKVVADFGKTLSDTRVKVAVFYYAGHGVQLDWRNYLVPVDATPNNAEELRKQSLDVSALLAYMQRAQQKGRSFLIVLDACRDDPFAGTYKPEAKGLSQFDAPSGSLLAYSTSPGKVALDGAVGASNGLYTAYLLKELAKRGAPIEDAFKRTRLNVRLASNGTQIPWESTSLEDDLYLFPGEVKKLSDRELDAALDAELRAWNKIKDSADALVVAEFVREYPSGNVSEIAMSKLNRLLSSQSNAETTRLVAKNLAVVEAKKAQEDRDRAEAARVVQVAAAQAAAAMVREQAERVSLAAAQAERVRLAQAKALADEQEAQRVEALRVAASKAEADKASALRMAFDAAQTLGREAARLAALQESARQAAAKIAMEVAQVAREAAAKELARQEAARIEIARLESQRIEAARLDALRLAEAKARADELAKVQLAQLEAQRRAAAQAEADRVQAASLAQAQQLARATEQARVDSLAAQAANELAQREAVAAAQAVAAERARAEASRLQLAQAEAQRIAQASQKAAAELAAREAADRAQAASTLAQFAAIALQRANERVIEADAPVALAALLPQKVATTPYYKGSNEFSRLYNVGDLHEFRVIDLFNRSEKPLSMAVTAVDSVAERVTFNGGDYVTDLMGNVLTNLRGSSGTPRQFYPADLFVGKRWKTMFKQQRPNGVSYTFSYDMRVVGRETITVPAGTFDTFKIEGRGFNMQLRASLERNIWVSPGISADIALETIVRLSNGAFDQRERQELVRYLVPSQKQMASN